MPLFPRKKRHMSCPTTSDDQPPAHTTTVVSDPAWNVDTHDDIAMNAIQTSLAVLQAGSSLAAKLPFIASIAGLLLQALTMRDEVKQCKEECEIVMHKLARIGKIIVNLCDKYNLSEEDLPASLRDILDSLQRELDRIERVLKKCSRRKGIKGFLLRKDLLTKIKHCDVELSNVLQAFQAELILDVRVSLIVLKPEAQIASDSGPIETAPAIHEGPNIAQISSGTQAKGGLDVVGGASVTSNASNAKEPINCISQAVLGPDLPARHYSITYSITYSTAFQHFFFSSNPRP
ncbi:hypothetical protein EI94DRAFT_546509 [Lactarius quietus]|nr:hypothetical protein EI94DRAFT_546509 [Lactarius quietus]